MKLSIIALLITVCAFYGIVLYCYAADLKDPKALFEETCSQCHSIDIPKGERMSKDDWAYTVGRMKNNGLSISDLEAAAIINYLAENYGKK